MVTKKVLQRTDFESARKTFEFEESGPFSRILGDIACHFFGLWLASTRGCVRAGHGRVVIGPLSGKMLAKLFLLMLVLVWLHCSRAERNYDPLAVQKQEKIFHLS